jgi:hypothetical protein
MPFGIRPSNVRVCHSTTRALLARAPNFPQSAAAGKYRFVLVLMFVIVIESLKRIPLEHDHDQENEFLAIHG